MEDRSLFARFIGISEESVDPGTNDNIEIFGEEGVLEPLGRSRLSRASFLGRAFNYSVPGSVWDGLVSFEEILLFYHIAKNCTLVQCMPCASAFV